MGIKLTDRIVQSLPAPRKGYKIHRDTDVKGFGVRVTAKHERIVDGKPIVTGGAKSFIFNYRFGGAEPRITIGSFPAWKTEDARKRAAGYDRDVDNGINPKAALDALRMEPTEAPTMLNLWTDYVEKHASSKKRPRSAAEDEAMWRKHIEPRLAKKPVGDVGRGDIETLHRDVSKKTPVRANRTLALLKKMFNLSIGWGLRADNPCMGIEKNREYKKERYLTPAELDRLMSALAVHRNKISANVVRLLLLTGARRGEVLGATWGQVDLDAGLWTKPAASTKQDKLHRVPLSAPARELLVGMHAARQGSNHLFPGRRDNEQQTDLKRFWASVCRDAGISGVRIHDLRHTYASYLVSDGLSLPIIGALLGHTQPETTQRYAHLMDDPLRAATEKVGARVTAAGKSIEAAATDGERTG